MSGSLPIQTGWFRLVLSRWDVGPRRRIPVLRCDYRAASAIRTGLRSSTGKKSLLARPQGKKRTSLPLVQRLFRSVGQALVHTRACVGGRQRTQLGKPEQCPRRSTRETKFASAAILARQREQSATTLLEIATRAREGPSSKHR